MRTKWLVALGIFFVTAGVCPAQDGALTTEKDKVSYVLGMIVGRDMKSQGIELNTDSFSRGFKDTVSGAKPMISDQEAEQIMAAFRSEMGSKAKKLGEQNKKAGEAFLADNKKKEGVKTLPSGVQYKVLKTGTGKMPTASDTVTVHYRGTLVDGTEFDSSYKRGEPATFPLRGVIPGWTEALQLMKTGSKWQIFIPAEKAYGESGAGGVIPPNSALIFEVELVSVQASK
jgi:FKBP-type peptidyl-prolyl cis-trans isomerase FklB